MPNEKGKSEHIEQPCECHAHNDEMKDLRNGESVSSQQVLQGQLPRWKFENMAPLNGAINP
jgi:hypothetical protein